MIALKKLKQNDFSVNLAFFFVVFTWSTSWIAIKFQVAHIPIGFSVSYRFFFASLVLFAIATIKKFPLNFSKKQFSLIFLQGINLFFFNHLFFYSGIHYVNSGVAATFSSLSVIIAPLIDYILHKNKTSFKLIIGGITGIIGVALISSSEINFNNFNNNVVKGLLFCFLGVTTFSLGSLVGKNLKLHNFQTLVSASAYSMFCGSCFSFLYTILQGNKIAFDFSPSYVLSLLYLILFPGIVGYLSILFLTEKIGASKASYTALLYPVAALIISGIFENYQFTYLTFFGIALVFGGNLIALNSKK